MKKRLLLISLALALVLTTLMPTAALAKESPKPPKIGKTFDASGFITGITEGTVYPVNPADPYGLWKVEGREIYATLSGDIAGDVTLTYDGQFLILTQEGTFSGDLATGYYQLEVNGESEPLEIVYIGGPFGYLPKIAINGSWSFITKEKKTKVEGYEGTFGAWIVFIPDAQGHIVQIVDSSLTMTGDKYKTNEKKDKKDKK
jgi:hypothetical protein